MKPIVFQNLLKMELIEDKDIIIYYNKHFAKDAKNAYKDLEDCISLLIEAKFICEDEIKDDLIAYYETVFNNNPNLVKKIIDEAINKTFENNLNLI